MKRFALFFALQFVSYGLVTWSIRALAKGFIWNMLAADGLIAVVGFTFISMIAEAKDNSARFGYVTGGMAGSAFGLLLTKHLWGS